MEAAQTGKEAEIIHNYLAKMTNRLRIRLLTAYRRGDENTASIMQSELLEVLRAKRAYENMLCRTQKEPKVLTYLISSLSIVEACNILTRSAEEDLRFATGIIVAPKTFAITRFLGFELKRKTVIAAEGEEQAVNRLLINLDSYWHKLFMTWHSHPGGGSSSTMPSSVDMDFHRRLEAGNYPVIGGIVNRQGYVRFFSYRRPFQVSIHGAGIEVIDERQCIFRLSKVGTF